VGDELSVQKRERTRGEKKKKKKNIDVFSASELAFVVGMRART
jgi:hypothetical protein